MLQTTPDMCARGSVVWVVALGALAVSKCARQPDKSSVSTAVPVADASVVRTSFSFSPSHENVGSAAPRRSLNAATGAVAPSAKVQPVKAPAAPAPEYAQLVGTYCVTCHNDRLKTAGLSLQALELVDVPAHAEVWEKVMRKVRTGEMPPSTVRSRPDAQTAGAFTTYLESVLDWSAAAHPNPGRTPVHRLNRAEYSNAVRDLLAVDVRPGEWLPVDDSGYGFDNIAAVLSTSPALLDRYMSAARKVSRLAVGDLTVKPVEEIYDVKRDPVKGSRNEQLNDELPFDSRAGMTVAHYFPLDAD